MTLSKTNYNASINTTKTLFFILAFTLIAFFSFAQDSKGQTITVTIDNVRNDKGVVLLGLHNDTTFMKADGLQTAKSKIENNKITATFTNVKPGEYAVMAIHDENENNAMDFENGMPTENYGMSNNPMSYGPPQYGDAKFTLSDTDLELKIRF